MNNTPPTASQLIRAAIAAAGGGTKLADRWGMSQVGVNAWARRGRIPSDMIKPLCEAGNFAISPDAILDALAREAAHKRAA